MSSDVRVRFAPSPTGHLHLGGVRTAIFNFLFARHHGGSFLLRIEDTDVARSKKEFVESQLASLEWLGLMPDEELVYQMSYVKKHNEKLDYLLENKLAYPCFCAVPDYDEQTPDHSGGDDRTPCACRDKAWTNDDLATPHAIRFKVPDDLQRIVFDDLIRGPIIVDRDQLTDFVIRRQDGTPTYNFCVVVDDMSMAITHVIRGEDHISNTPKQIMIYQALGSHEIPQFAHLPLILGPEGNRLSKRDAAVAVSDYREQGIMADALFNYLVRLGWSHGDQEVFSKDEMISLFELKNVGKKGAIFDQQKLEWLNGVYLRQATAVELLKALEAMQHGSGAKLSQKWSSDVLKKLFALYVERVATLRELADQINQLAHDPASYDLSRIEKWRTDDTPAMLRKVLDALASMDSLEGAQVSSACKQIVADHGAKVPALAQPLRLALTGTVASPGIFELVAVVGKEIAKRRIEALIAAME